MLLGQGAHRFNLIVRALDSPRAAAAKELRLYPDGKELRIQPSLSCSDCIEVPILQSPAEVDVLVNQPLRRIGMHVNDDGAAVN